MDEKIIFTILPNLIKLLNIKGIRKIPKINRAFMYLFRTTNISLICNKVTNRKDKLTIFSALTKYLPAQKSDAWLLQRTGSFKDPLYDYLKAVFPEISTIPTPIGGSEIACLRDEDKYKTEKELIKGKLKIEKFDGNVHTRWGTMFEPVLNSYTERVFDTKLAEFGSCPGLRDSTGLLLSSYSPDGIGVIDGERIWSVFLQEDLKNKQINAEDLEKPKSQRKGQIPQHTVSDELYNIKQSERIVLFEFKCPLQRIPTGHIPRNYLSQPLLGMSSLEIPEFAIFGDACFRKCSINDFKFNTIYDKTNSYVNFKDPPVVMGFIGIYSTIGEPYCEKQIPDLDVLKKIILRLFEVTVNYIKHPGSRYFGLIGSNAVYNQIPILVNCVYAVFEKLLCDEFNEFKITSEQNEQIIWNILMRFIPTLKELNQENKKNTKMLMSECIKVAVIQKQYDLDNIKFGIDLGVTKRERNKSDQYTTVAFDDLMKSIKDGKLSSNEQDSLIEYAIDGKHNLKLYHHEKFCYNSRVNDENFTKNNPIDPALSESNRCKAWLWSNLKVFEEFCLKSGFTPIGVIPWKLMKIHYMPVYKQPNFLNENKENLIRVTNIIKKLKPLKQEEQLAELDLIYPEITIFDMPGVPITNTADPVDDGITDAFDDLF